MVTAEPSTDNNASFLRAARAGNLEKVLEYLKGNIDINISNANGLNALHLASKEGHVNVVTELLKRGANVNAATKKGNTALHIASLAGQYEVAKVLVNLGANVNVQSLNGFTPLYMAAQENHDNVVSFLLANGANQSLATEDGFTPLAVALQQGHDKVVAVLLENDTKGKVRLPALHIAAKKDDCKAATLLLQNDHNPDVTSKSGFTPLHIAAHYGNENIANILLDKGADVNYAAKHQITPLHVASKWGKSNMVTLLLDKRANIEASTRDGLTPLHCAARSGHDQVVDLLLERGAPILAKTKNGLAPLHMASQGDHVDSARILLYHKAPVDDVTVDYLTALHVAAHCGHVKVAKLLLDRKADPNARALNGFTPLHIACKKNRIKVVELLLKHGASIEATTESGLTPLHVASFMGCMNIVIYLIQNGANPDVPTVRGETPLHLAARANQTDIIRILLRNGANVDARAREEQTPLHIAARLGNVDIVSLLLQHGAAVDATTKDMYTALHIAAKEDQEEVASVLLDHGASLTSTTKKGFTPLHLAAKYGNIKVARLLLQKDAPVDAQGKNGVTPLHVASHYDHVNVALLLLDKGASPHAMAKNGYTPLHIAAKKNQMDIATTLLEYGAKANSESKAGFTPLHLASQDGHTDMTTLLIEHQADANFKANNGLTPLHLCAQEDRVNVATVLVKNGAEIGPQTKAGYTPLHVASHFGQINMVRFLLQQNADVHMTTSHGYTPLHQAAQQGHTLVVNLLLENQASPNVTTSQGQTALSIAQRLGYISVVETLKVVTETTVTTTTTTVTEEKYKVVAPETMQETFMTDSEDEGGEDVMLGDQSYRYLTADEMKSLGDDSLPIDVTKDEKQHEAIHPIKESPAPMVEEDHISPQHITPVEVGFSEKYSPDNVDLSRAPVHAGHFRDFDWDDTGYFSIPSQGMLRSSRLKWKTFLVSFMVDARGGAMRGCRHSGVRVIIPPRKASMPMRITCRYLRKEKLIHPPPLMEGEACASRILEVGPVGARFLGPVIIEVPHFASLRGKEREITILRSDTGETWREHTLEASEEAVQEVLNESFEGDELSALEDLNTNRITRILTTDFPQYFAVVTRIRQEVHGVGPEGGMVSSTVVPQVQAVFPVGALTKKIRVGLQAQPIAPELVAKLLGNRVAVSPIVTVEPRRRKFHKPITLTIPVPQAATKGMINQYSGDAPTLRLLCSITGSTKSGGSSKAQWEDVTGSTPLQFVSDCVSFTTTVSARFWLMDCRQVNEASKFATELYQEAVHVPFMSKFVIFAKRNEPNEAQLRVFCMTDDKEDKTLETQENFTEIAKSRDVEVLEGKLQYLEFAGNLVPVTKSGEQLKLAFQAFHENRLAFTIRVKDPHVEPMGRIAFMKEPKAGRGEPPQVPICNLNVALPEVVVCDSVPVTLELVTLEKRDDFIQESGLSKPESIHRADLRLSDIARELDKDWVGLAQQLEISESDINVAKSEFPDDVSEQALIMLRMWLQTAGSRATGNELEKGLRKINREDIIKKCMFNVELVTDDVEKAVAKVHLDQSGFDVFKEELGSSREASMRRGASLDISYDEQDIMKDAESAAETSSETGSIFERDQISQVFSDEKENLPLLHDVSPITAIAAESEETTISPDAEMVENHINKLDNDFSVFHDITPQVSTINESEGNHKDFESITDAANWIQDDNIVSCVTQEGSENEYFSPSPSNMPNSDADTLSYSDRLNFPKNETDQHDSMELIETDILLKEEYKSYNEPQNMTDDVEFVNSNNLANIKSQMEDFKETESYFSNDDSNYSSHNEFVDNEHLSPLDTSFETSCYVISDDHHEDTEKVSTKLPFEEFTDKITAEIIEMASSAKINDDFKCDSLLDSSVPEEKFDEEEAQNSVLSLDKEVLIESDLIYDNLVNKNQLFGKDPALFADSCNAPINNVSFELNVGGSTRYTNSEIPQSAEPEIHKNIPDEVEEQVFLYEVAKPEECISSDNAGFETDPNYDPECESSESPDDSMESLVENVDSPTSDDLHKTEGRLSPVSDNPDPTDRFIEEARIRRVSKTPPPSPAEIITKEFIEEKSTAEEKVLVENEVLEKEGIIIKEEVPTAAPKPIETVDEMMKPVIEVPEVAAKQTESETWPSGEMDTSQVSVSSLPDDEKSETTTATVSSATAADVETETKVVETKEWTETDDSGAVKHVIQKTTHMTLSMQQKSDDKPDEEGTTKEIIPESHVSEESGDQLCTSPSPEAKSTKRTDEVFRDEAYEIMCHQSDNIVNLDFDTFEQGTAVPKKGNYVDIQEASAGLTYLDMDNNLKSQPTECDVDNVESLKDHMQPDVTSHLQGSKTYDLHFNNEPSQKVEAADFEQNINRDLNSPLEAKAEFHTAVRDLYSEPTDIKTTDEEFFIHKQYPCELTTGSLEESIRQYKLEDLQSGVTENSDVLKQGIDVDVESGHEYMTEALKDYESGQYNIPEKGVELVPDLEYQHNLEEQELEKTCKTKIFDQGSVLITELEPESGLEDVMHDEMSKPNISEQEKGSFMEIGHQYPSEVPGTHIFELEAGSDVEFSHQYPFVDPEQSEICRAGVFELGTGPVTEMGHHNIREGLEAREICKTSFPDGEFEAPYAVEDPEHYEPGKANIPGFEIGVFTEMEHERFINNLRVTENNKTSVPEHKTETEIATNLENQCNLGKDEFGTKSEQLHSHQVQGCDESFKPCFPEEGIDLLEKSQCQHASDMFEYEEIDIPNLGEQRIETITESGNPYSIQDLELDAMKVNSEWPNLFGFTDENREKMPDDKSTETVMPDETTPNSSISVNPETYTRYQVNIPDEIKAVGQPEVTENKYELNSPFDLNTPSAPALATYSPEQTKSPSYISEIDTPQSETEIDRNEPAFEQSSDKSFENIEQNLYAASARETDESAIYGLSADGQNPMSSEIIFHPEELNYSFLKTENLGQKLVCGSTHDKEFENVQETDDLLKSRDIQDTNTGGSSHADVTPSLHEKSCTEMKFDDHYPTIAPKGDITNPEFPEELFLTEEKSSPEQTYFATEQQQLKYVPFPPPISLKNLQEVEDLSGRIRSIIQQEGDLDNHTRIPGDFSLSGSYRQPDTDQEGETSQAQTFETIVDSQPGSVTTRRIVTTTSTVHHIPEGDGAFSSSPVVSGETTDLRQGAQDDSCHLSSEHQSFHVDDH